MTNVLGWPVRPTKADVPVPSPLGTSSEMNVLGIRFLLSGRRESDAGPLDGAGLVAGVLGAEGELVRVLGALVIGGDVGDAVHFVLPGHAVGVVADEDEPARGEELAGLTLHGRQGDPC